MSAGQAAPGQAAYEAFSASIMDRESHFLGVGWNELDEITDTILLREDFEAAAQAAVTAWQAQNATAEQQPQAAPGPHHHTSVLECEDCLLRSAVLAEVEAAAEAAADTGNCDCGPHVDAILAIVADAYAGTRAGQAAPGDAPVYLGTLDTLTEALTGFNVDINDHGFTAAGVVDNPAVAARGLLARLGSAEQTGQAAPGTAAVTLAKVLGWFKPEDGTSYPTRPDAMVTRAQLASAYQDGGLEVPDELRRFL